MNKPCKAYRAVLDAILDGVEDLDSRARLESHALECEGCADALAETQRMRSTLETLVEGQSTRIDDEAFVEAVFAKIDQSSAADLSGPRTSVSRAPRPWPILLVGAATAAAAAAALVIVLRGDAPQTADETAPREIAATAAEAAAERERARGEQVNAVGTGGEVLAQPLAPVLPDESPASTPEIETRIAPLTESEMDGFRLALTQAAEAAKFDPETAENARAFAAAVDSPLADPRRAARAILGSALAALDLAKETSLSQEALLAARFLGPRADARDRVLLKGSLEKAGAAGAWALVDRGAAGVAALWPLALIEGPSEESSEKAAQARPSADQTARAVLLAAAKEERLDLERLPRVRNGAALAAAVVSAGSGDSAGALLASFLESGETPWLDAWAAQEGAAASLTAALESAGPARLEHRRAERLLRAIERSGSAQGLPFTLRALKGNVDGAALALSAIQGSSPVLALIDTTQSGVLKDDVEERAWLAMARAGSARVLSAALEDSFDANRRAEVLLGSLVRGTENTLHPEEQRVLAGLGAEPTLFSETRSQALLLLAEKCGPGGRRGSRTGGGALQPELQKVVKALRTDPDPMVSAAAWLVHLNGSDPAPPHVARVISRSSSPAVRHARLTRSIQKARAREARGSF